MNFHYSAERSIQVFVALLKEHNIKKVIASPGSANHAFVACLQSDPFFEMYSSVDERSAAYLATGMAAESGEPVILTCTGATASRNYFPGLTEAFYRNLPILAVTATQSLAYVGEYFPQSLDRSIVGKDVVKHSITVDHVHDELEEWGLVNDINYALLELKRNGGGPVHINLVTTRSNDYSVKTLPNVRVVKRVKEGDEYPKIGSGKLAIYVGSHQKWSDELTQLVDSFCLINNAVVFGDLTSNYKGKYKIQDNLFGSQDYYKSDLLNVDLLIYIGYVTGAYSSIKANEVWRVNPDGQFRDYFKKTTFVFEMKEETFFKNYTSGESSKTEYFKKCRNEYDNIYKRIPDLPFSNIWCAKKLAPVLPKNSVLHLGILNTLRSWNFFEIPNSVNAYCNVGGFGIDGIMSSLIGASLVDRKKIYFGVLGDLAFFYDMNVLGNHIVGNNVRIMLINNGKGVEFRNYNHPVQLFDEDADKFMAAAGHFGQKSPTLVKNYAENLGYEYISASNKEEFISVFEKFVSPEIGNKPIVFEVFTDYKDESNALKAIRTIEIPKEAKTKSIIKDFIGQDNINKIKNIMKG